MNRTATRRGLLAVAVAAPVALVKGDTMRSDDLAPLLGPTPPPAGNVTFRQGVVRTWNPFTAENTVEVGGSLLSNLPTIASSGEVLAMQAGDVVGIQVVGNGATSTMYIIGRITHPGTVQAASFMDLFGLVSASETTQGAALTSFSVAGLGDLEPPATPGPSVTVTVGQTGRVLVLIAVEIVSWRGTVGFVGGSAGVTVSGANNILASDQIGVGWKKYIASDAPAAFESWLMSGSHVYKDLNPGQSTFTLKYGRGNATCDTAVKNREIVALPL